MIKLKRIYEPPGPQDGFRILVDRLWPRGVSKSKGAVNLWLKEIAPSSELRGWFAHEPRKWEIFKKRYAKELESRRDLLRQIRRAERDSGTVTLLYAAKDRGRNNAVALKEFLRNAPRHRESFPRNWESSFSAAPRPQDRRSGD
jgi:uncharacterized protein YeaO (DUF488 family)